MESKNNMSGLEENMKSQLRAENTVRHTICTAYELQA